MKQKFFSILAIVGGLYLVFRLLCPKIDPLRMAGIVAVIVLVTVVAVLGLSDRMKSLSIAGIAKADFNDNHLLEG